MCAMILTLNNNQESVYSQINLLPLLLTELVTFKLQKCSGCVHVCLPF